MFIIYSFKIFVFKSFDVDLFRCNIVKYTFRKIWYDNKYRFIEISDKRSKRSIVWKR